MIAVDTELVNKNKDEFITMLTILKPTKKEMKAVEELKEKGLIKLYIGPDESDDSTAAVNSIKRCFGEKKYLLIKRDTGKSKGLLKEIQSLLEKADAKTKTLNHDMYSVRDAIRRARTKSSYFIAPNNYDEELKEEDDGKENNKRI